MPLGTQNGGQPAPPACVQGAAGRISTFTRGKDALEARARNVSDKRRAFTPSQGAQGEKTAGAFPLHRAGALNENVSCEDGDGGVLNVNADTAAMAVAQALGAEKLVFLSDVNGVRRDKENPDTIIHSLSESESKAMIGNGQIASGMIPKVEACLETLDRGVGKVHIIDGRLRHSLLLEIYTSEGVGTEIYKDLNI